MAVTAKDCHALTSYFRKRYKEHYGREPDVNIWSARWGFDAVLRGLNFQEAQNLLDYYFTTSSERLHDLDWFFNNYHRLAKAKRDQEEDKARTAKLMAESKERAEQWRLSGKRGIASPERGTTE